MEDTTKPAVPEAGDEKPAATPASSTHAKDQSRCGCKKGSSMVAKSDYTLRRIDKYVHEHVQYC